MSGNPVLSVSYPLPNSAIQLPFNFTNCAGQFPALRMLVNIQSLHPYVCKPAGTIYLDHPASLSMTFSLTFSFLWLHGSIFLWICCFSFRIMSLLHSSQMVVFLVVSSCYDFSTGDCVKGNNTGCHFLSIYRTSPNSTFHLGRQWLLGNCI